jgi:hypothetical protein
MNTRVFTLLSSAAALALFAGCTVYKNAATCADTMRSAASEQAASETLKISHTGAGIHGRRVVVEGAFESMVPASSVAAITASWATPPATGASGASAANASAASTPAAVAAHPAASAPTEAAAPSQTLADVPPPAPSTSTSMAGVLAPTFASSPAETGTASQKPAAQASKKPVKLAIPAAIECKFDGVSLTSFRWLTPGRLVTHTDSGETQ